MTKHLKLPHDGLVLVSDGRKALLLKNAGDEVRWNLKVEKVLNAPDNPSTAQQGTDKPGRAFMVGGPRSAVEQTDWHALAEARFAADVAAEIEGIAPRAGTLIVAAPPRTLAELRKHFSDAVKGCIIAEINKDLTKHPVHEIEEHLLAKL
ncbi:baeRF12 domain-containing protein [Microvirga sp. 2TAF3]|uniref:baeRF12 domain-containing protein n=1 Tax=Microvirga sp. 2TAF3 TaxID=3233014 RepID=UPI003F9BADB3